MLDFEEAINKLYERDFRDQKGQFKNPIFIPELFIKETNYDYDQLREQIETMSENEKFMNLVQKLGSSLIF